MNHINTPILHGSQLFRKGMQIYINRSDEAFQDYMNVLHRHDFIEVVYVVEGKGVHQVGESLFATSPGDLFIINHNVPHRFFSEEFITGEDTIHGQEVKNTLKKTRKLTASKTLIVYNCIFTPAFLDISLLGTAQFESIASSYLFKNLFPEINESKADLHLAGADFHEFGSLFSSMYSEYQNQEKGYSDIIRASLITLMIKMFRLLDQKANIKEKDDIKPETAASEFHKELVNNALAFMAQHTKSDIRLEEVAMNCFVSKNYFSRLFREVTGIKFSDHVQKIRIDEVVRLLETTSEHVYDIALGCGFHDMKHFYSTFRKYTGKTPREVRNSLR